jgi:hypothetical protein
MHVIRTTAIETSKQVRAHLPCSGFEKRFSTHGEDWTIRNPRHAPDDLPLHEGSSKSKPIAENADVRMYLASDVPQLKIEQPVYFGACVFGAPCVDGHLVIGLLNRSGRGVPRETAGNPRRTTLASTSTTVRKAIGRRKRRMVRERTRSAERPHRLGTARGPQITGNRGRTKFNGMVRPNCPTTRSTACDKPIFRFGR